MKLTSRNLMFAVVKAKGNPFFLRPNDCVVENVSWGMFTWGEADLIALTKAGYLIEGEVKISKADFLHDSAKRKWRERSGWSRDIRRFFYIVPIELKDFVLENTDKGVISVSVTEFLSYDVKIERESNNNDSRKLSVEEKLKLMRLGCMKAWKR